jgi:hypothetical protein
MIDILLFGLTIIILFLFVRRKPKNFPPGPPNLPLIGSIPFLEKDLRKTITKLRMKYGPGKCSKIDDESSVNEVTIRKGYGRLQTFFHGRAKKLPGRKKILFAHKTPKRYYFLRKKEKNILFYTKRSQKCKKTVKSSVSTFGIFIH